MLDYWILAGMKGGLGKWVKVKEKNQWNLDASEIKELSEWGFVGIMY